MRAAVAGEGRNCPKRRRIFCGVEERTTEYPGGGSFSPKGRISGYMVNNIGKVGVLINCVICFKLCATLPYSRRDRAPVSRIGQ